MFKRVLLSTLALGAVAYLYTQAPGMRSTLRIRSTPEIPPVSDMRLPQIRAARQLDLDPGASNSPRLLPLASPSNLEAAPPPLGPVASGHDDTEESIKDPAKQAPAMPLPTTSSKTGPPGETAGPENTALTPDGPGLGPDSNSIGSSENTTASNSAKPQESLGGSYAGLRAASKDTSAKRDTASPSGAAKPKPNEAPANRPKTTGFVVSSPRTPPRSSAASGSTPNSPASSDPAPAQPDPSTQNNEEESEASPDKTRRKKPPKPKKIPLGPFEYSVSQFMPGTDELGNPMVSSLSLQQLTSLISGLPTWVRNDIDQTAQLEAHASKHMVPLGYRGKLIITLPQGVITNGKGPDLAVFMAPLEHRYSSSTRRASVYAADMSEGVTHYCRLGQAGQDASLAGQALDSAGGDRFDLDVCGLQRATHVMIEDISEKGSDISNQEEMPLPDDGRLPDPEEKAAREKTKHTAAMRKKLAHLAGFPLDSVAILKGEREEYAAKD